MRLPNDSRIRHGIALEAVVSKLMFGFMLLCSVVIYNPEAIRGFTIEHASELTSQLKGALYTLDRLLPSFMRFSRG
jgi:hypothetical protein